MKPNVETKDVHKEYKLGERLVQALRGVSVTIYPGEFAAFAGPSGSGKSTLLNLVGCMDVPTRGEVLIDGQVVGALNETGLTNLRLNKLGFIFQSFNLIPVLTVFQNVELPLMLQGKVKRQERRSRVLNLLEAVGLLEQQSHRPKELSGGQQQRVAVARALVAKPALVLADEPTANLDSKTGTQIIDLMRDMSRKENTTFIFSTHDPKVMKRADRVFELADGLVVDEYRGTESTGEIRASPTAH